jgi:uncharacterized membrane protein
MRPRSLIALVLIVLLLSTLLSPVLAQAQEGQPQASTQDLTLFTRYPAQETAIGEAVSFELKLRATEPQIVRLSTQNLPQGWTTTFRGGGKVIQAAYVDSKEDTTVDLKVEAPKDVRPSTYRFAVVARSEANEVLAANLPIELSIKDKLPPRLTLDVDLPTLKGGSDTTFRYSATLKNEGDAEMNVNLVADAPEDFQVNFKLSGQDVTSFPIGANESKSLSIEAKPLSTIPAGPYQMKVLAQSGQFQAATDLTAEVTGQPDLSVSAPDGRLSGQAYAGDETSVKLMVQNTGSAPARNIKLSASSPSGWSVKFTPEQIAEVPSGQQVEVTANIQPNKQTIAGDYMVNVTAKPETGPSKAADFRITVLTSTLWGMVGVALIAVAVAIVGLAVLRFGRR